MAFWNCHKCLESWSLRGWEPCSWAFRGGTQIIITLWACSCCFFIFYLFKKKLLGFLYSIRHLLPFSVFAIFTYIFLIILVMLCSSDSNIALLMFLLGYISTLRNNVRSRAWGAAIGCSYCVERCCIVKVIETSS